LRNRHSRFNTAIIFILLLSACASVGKHPAKQKDYLEQGGIIKRNTVWSGNIHLRDDILVSRGVTLTLQAGCRVTVSEKPHFRLEPMFISEKTEILLLGSLNIEGKKGKEVHLLTLSERGRGWAGIIMSGDSSSLSMRHATLKGADVGVYVLAGRAVISNTTFTENDTGVLVQGGEAIVHDSSFTHNKRGIALFAGKADVTKSTIKNNETGIMGKNIRLVESSVVKNSVNFQ